VRARPQSHSRVRNTEPAPGYVPVTHLKSTTPYVYTCKEAGPAARGSSFIVVNLRGRRGESRRSKKDQAYAILNKHNRCVQK